MTTFFKSLFEYNDYFNAKLAQSFIENQNRTSEESVKLFNHILNAHQIWNCRIHGNSNTCGIWEIHKPSEYEQLIKVNYENSIFALDKFAVNDTIQYSNSRGQNFRKNKEDILFHIINHSTYHRGQIATDFRKSGLEPLVSDYIFFKR